MDDLPNLTAEEGYSTFSPMLSDNLVEQTSIHDFGMIDSAFRYGSDELTVATVTTKALIAVHPQFPRLLQAHIDFIKAGAPPIMGSVLDEIRREYDMHTQEAGVRTMCTGANHELDQFMENYCDVLDKYKSDFSRPFEEATNFLNKVEMELQILCDSSPINNSYRNQGSSEDEECIVEEIDEHDVQPRDDEERDMIKDQLLRRFGCRIRGLKLQFCKNRKKSKISKEARQLLFQWWNTHWMWPYPTDVDKIGLGEKTGLAQSQINNWFINQRKRHWKRGYEI